MKHKRLKNLSLSFISLILFITLAEIIARVFSAPAIGKPSQGILLEGTNRSFIHAGIMYETNSLGLRNEEVTFGREKTTFRLLVLGDSFIWGDGLDNEELVMQNVKNVVKKVIISMNN